MSARQTISVARHFIDALMRHDDDAAFAIVRRDAPVTVTGRNVLSGAFPSPKRYRETVDWIFREHDAGIDTLSCESLSADAQTAVAIVVERAHRDVGELVYRLLIVMRIEAEFIAELHMIAEDPYALDAFWE